MNKMSQFEVLQKKNGKKVSYIKVQKDYTALLFSLLCDEDWRPKENNHQHEN